MTIQEILEAHLSAVAYEGPATCSCEEWESRQTGLNSTAQHRAHVAEVLEQYMHQTRRGVWDRAYSAGWNDGEWRDNPYATKETPNGR